MLSTTVQRAAAIAAVVVLAIVGLTLASRGNPAVGVSPTPSPSSTGSAAASAAAVVPSSSAAADTCGGPTYSPDPGAPAPRIPSTTMLHNSGAILAAGVTYSTSRFSPAFSFVGQACWTFGGDSETTASVSDTGSGLLFMIRPSSVIDPSGTARAVPADLVAWIRSDKDLIIAKSTTLSLGGFTATLLPGTFKPTATLNSGGSYNLACDTPPAECVAAANAGNELGFEGNQPFELVVVNVRGQTLLIGVTSSTADWPTARPALEAIVASLRFPG